MALDTVLCAIAGIDAKTVESLVLAAQYGEGVNNPGDIAMFGDDLRDILANDAEHEHDHHHDHEHHHGHHHDYN